MAIKKTIGILSLVVSLLANATYLRPAFAIGTTASPSGARPQANQANVIASLKARADQEITRRLIALNNLVTRLNAMVRLSASQKSTLTAQVQTEITNLTSLKTKIAADTDLPTLRTDVQSIVKSYRVYLVFMPQISTLSYVDRMGTVVTNMNTVLGKLQTRVAQAQSAGKNVGAAPTLLTTIQSELTDANNQLTTVTNQILPLTPASYPGSQAIFQSAKTSLQTVQNSDLKPARQNISQVIQILRSLNSNSTATPSATR